ncbi:hypothetical protein EBS80_02565 [bacterium]|nr:hypothetical protein [bacterium]
MREPFDSKAYYHVYNRGVDKRVVFSDEDDFRRFYESLFLFNDLDYKHPGGHDIDRDVMLAGYEMRAAVRVPLVRVMAFCLKPNHFHLLLKASEPDGISRFLHRLGMGYANYFNLKYGRRGRLWEGPFKAKAVDTDEHLQLLPRYIHLNALDGTGVGWRAGELSNWDAAMPVLDRYSWSSHGAYMGRTELLPVVDIESVRRWFTTDEDYLRYLKLPMVFGQEETTFARL